VAAHAQCFFLLRRVGARKLDWLHLIDFTVGCTPTLVFALLLHSCTPKRAELNSWLSFGWVERYPLDARPTLAASPIFFVTRGSQAYATPATRQPEKRKKHRVAHADNSKIFIFVCTPQLLSRSCSELGLNFVSEKCPFSELGPKFVSGHRSLCTKISRNVHESSRSRAFFTCISLYSFVYVQVLRSSNSTPPQADPFGVQRAVLPSQSRTQH